MRGVTSLAMSGLLLEHGKPLHREAIVEEVEKRMTSRYLYLFTLYHRTHYCIYFLSCYENAVRVIHELDVAWNSGRST